MTVTSVLVLEVSSATYQEVRQKLVDLGREDYVIYRKVVSIPEGAEPRESICMDGVFLIYVQKKGD